MSTRGVVIERKEKGKPEFYYIRSDADMYDEYAKKYGSHPNSVNSGVMIHEPGYNKKDAVNYIRTMNEIEGKNYLTGTELIAPEYVYEYGPDGALKKHKAANAWQCGPDEEFVSGFVKKNGEYVNGYCRKRNNRETPHDIEMDAINIKKAQAARRRR